MKLKRWLPAVLFLIPLGLGALMEEHPEDQAHLIRMPLAVEPTDPAPQTLCVPLVWRARMLGAFASTVVSFCSSMPFMGPASLPYALPMVGVAGLAGAALGGRFIPPSWVS